MMIASSSTPLREFFSSFFVAQLIQYAPKCIGQLLTAIESFLPMVALAHYVT